MQFKKVLAYALIVCLLVSLTVPAYAADDLIYSVDTDADLVYIPQVYYTEGYTPGMYADVDRSSSLFASTRVTYGSYSYYGYAPNGSYRTESGSVRNFVMSDYEPVVNVTSSVISAAQTVPSSTLIYGDLLNVVIPSTADSYFDFSGSTLLYDQSDALANTFILNGTFRFKLSNLWSITSGSSDYDDVSFYRASDPLAIQFLVNGKPYGHIIDVTSYTSPFTAATSGNPAFASVTFNNLKVYYNGDTPELIGFRIYTGSSYGSYTYAYGSYLSATLQNLLSLQWSEQPDISFVQEGGDGYAGDLSGIQSVLNSILSAISGLRSLMVDSSGNSYLSRLPSIDNYISYIYRTLVESSSVEYLASGGWINTSSINLVQVVREGFLGLRSLLSPVQGSSYLNSDATVGTVGAWWGVDTIIQYGFLGLATLSRNAQSYVADTVFPWQSYNMETHQLNAATNITGQNNLFFTAFQSIEDKLGRLAYVFGSDEDLALKDDADPGTDAFRENFGGGASLSDIKDASELTTTIPQIMDSGFDFGDALEEIGSNDDFLKWFSTETWAALDITGAVVAADPDYLSDYYDNLRKVDEKRHWGD